MTETWPSGYVVRHALCGEPAGAKTVPTEDEFLTAQQIQSYFSRRAPKLGHMHGSGKLRQLSLAMLLSICEHFDIYVGNIKERRKAP